jgi:putative ABC transport system permease protein
MWRFLEQFTQDLRFGIRSLMRAPGFTATAVTSLALGIMAATAIYSVIHAVILDPFPYKDVDSLMSVRVWNAAGRGGRVYYTSDQFLEIAERSTIFNGVVASTISDVLWTRQGEPQRLRGNFGTPNTFEAMGVPPLLGRAITPADGAPDATPVAVLGYKFWQRQFGGDAGVLGQQMKLNGRFRTVVGVMPKRFMWRGADVYLPVVLHRGETLPGVNFVHLLGRLKPGVTAAQAEADLRPIIEFLKQRQSSEFPEKWRVSLLPFKETFPSGIREALWILFGAVGLLLLIGCANVSNLLLARASARQREIAVRAALGAGRMRLARQLLTESLVLAIMGGGLGVLLASPALKAVVSLVPPMTIPDEAEILINTPVLLFTAGVSVLTALLFGLAPALHACTTNLVTSLKDAGRGVSGGWRHALVRNSLVVTEVALSLMLLVGASLMLRTLVGMESVDFGIRTDRILTLRVPLPEQRYPNAARNTAFFRELLPRVASVPGVAAVGLNSWMHPFGNMGLPVEVVGEAQADSRPVLIHHVNEDYTRVYGIGLVRGRMFGASEIAATQHVAVVNETLARRLGGSDPIGRIVRIPRLKPAPFRVADPSFQVIGVVKDTVNRTLANEVQPEIYLPYSITGIADRVVVLSQMAPESIVNAVRAQVYAVDPDQPVMDVRTVEGFLRDFIWAGPRFNLVLFTIFAVLGLALAVIGVYGVISNAVSQQTHEIGVRIALGAGFREIAGMVLRRGLALVAIGIGVGLAGSLAAVRLLSRQLWNVSPFDPLSFTVVALLLLVVGAQACFWPARRAAKVDPLVALRYE